MINRLPLRKTTGVVENFGFHVKLLIVFFFYIGLKCYFNYFVLYIYIA